MRVELLHFEGCPLALAAYRLVRQCLIALGIPEPVLVRVGDGPSPPVVGEGIEVRRPAGALGRAGVCRIGVPPGGRVLAPLTGARAAESGDAWLHSDQLLPPPP